MTTLTKAVTDQGYKYFDWNVSSGDAGGTTSTEEVYQNVVNGMKSQMCIRDSLRACCHGCYI